MSHSVLVSAIFAISRHILEHGSIYGPSMYSVLRSRLQSATSKEWSASNKTAYINVFRNYRRIFAGFLLADVRNGHLCLLENGSWIVENNPNAVDFYFRLASTYKYPNFAFQGQETWSQSNRVLSPMLVILRCLESLIMSENDDAYLTVDDVLSALYGAHDGLADDVLADAVRRLRTGRDASSALPRTPQSIVANADDRRQVREILAFLAMTGLLIKNHGSIRGDTRFALAGVPTFVEPVPSRRRPGASSAGSSRRFMPENDQLEEALEGEISEETRRIRKRIPSLRRSALQRFGWTCKACGIDYSAVLGDRGRAAVDVHHLRPISFRIDSELTRVKDLAVLCANCHRMVHAGGALLTPSELREFLLRPHE